MTSFHGFRTYTDVSGPIHTAAGGTRADRSRYPVAVVRAVGYIAVMKRERGIAIGTLLAGCTVAAAWLGRDYRVHPRLVSGPMVQAVTTDGFTLIWEMHPPAEARVQLYAAESLVAEYPVKTGADLRCELKVTGLQPGQAYRYQIQPFSYLRTVRTAPAGPAPFRFLAIGDTGDGEWPQWRIARILGSFTPDIILHTGDVVYPRGSIADYPRHFFQPYAGLIDRAALYPCLGNHDVRIEGRPALLDVFVLPRNGPDRVPPERVYWFDYGGARFAAIDTNLDFEVLRDAVAPWLETVFGDPGDGWKIVFFHEPLYTHGKYDEAVKVRDSLLPALDRAQIDLVLCGHNHMYERTHPLRGGRIAGPGEGTVFVTTGAGGANLYRLRPEPPEYLAAWDDTQHGFTIVDVSGDLLHLRQIGEGGDCIDDFHIARRQPTTQSAGEVAVKSLDGGRVQTAGQHRDAIAKLHRLTSR